MSEQQNPDNFREWVDPDVIHYYENDPNESNMPLPLFDREQETTFKSFFAKEWKTPEFDDIRERWDPLITDPDPHGRVLGKTALWSLVQYRRLRSAKTQKQNAHEEVA